MELLKFFSESAEFELPSRVALLPMHTCKLKPVSQLCYSRLVMAPLL